VELKASLTQNTTSAYCEKRVLNYIYYASITPNLFPMQSSETTSPEEKSIWLLMRNNFEDSKRGGLMQLWGVCWDLALQCRSFLSGSHNGSRRQPLRRMSTRRPRPPPRLPDHSHIPKWTPPKHFPLKISLLLVSRSGATMNFANSSWFRKHSLG
jgi:hypothetical protein